MTAITGSDRTRLRSTAALVSVSLALLLQALAPPGYMAGSLDQGWPVVLCPEGLPSGFLGHDDHQGHHHHGDDKTAEDVSLDGYCPLGGMLDAATPLHAAVVGTAEPGRTLSASVYPAPVPARRVVAPPSRAPPTPDSTVA